MKIHCWVFNQHQMPTHPCFFLSSTLALSKSTVWDPINTKCLHKINCWDPIQPTPTVVDTYSLKIIVSESDNARSLHLSQRQPSHTKCVDVFNDMSLARLKIECCKEFHNRRANTYFICIAPKVCSKCGISTPPSRHTHT